MSSNVSLLFLTVYIRHAVAVRRSYYTSSTVYDASPASGPYATPRMIRTGLPPITKTSHPDLVTSFDALHSEKALRHREHNSFLIYRPRSHGAEDRILCSLHQVLHPLRSVWAAGCASISALVPRCDHSKWAHTHTHALTKDTLPPKWPSCPPMPLSAWWWSNMMHVLWKWWAVPFQPVARLWPRVAAAS